MPDFGHTLRMGRLRELLGEDTPDITAVEAYLDSLDSEQRVAEIRTLGRRHQARLFEVARGHRPISLDDIVDSTRPPMKEVVHYGKNSLPAFSHFAKVFVRPGAASSNELWGYNRSGSFIETVVGPGYFVVYPNESEGEVLVDYLRVPPERPPEWPEILPNSSRLSAFVYNGTQDVLRGVSKHVTVGRAFKGGKPMSAWFVLCRSDS
jgi:hypothetical protein